MNKFMTMTIPTDTVARLTYFMDASYKKYPDTQFILALTRDDDTNNSTVMLFISDGLEEDDLGALANSFTSRVQAKGRKTPDAANSFKIQDIDSVTSFKAKIAEAHNSTDKPVILQRNFTRLAVA